jgi:hypothetical protein
MRSRLISLVLSLPAALLLQPLAAETLSEQLLAAAGQPPRLYSPFEELTVVVDQQQAEAVEPGLVEAVDEFSWSGAIEMGISATRGNSQTLSQSSAVDLQRLTTFGRLDIELDYLKASSNKRTTDHHLLLDIAHRWIEDDERKGWFARFALEYDEFRAFDVRTSVNSGRAILFYDDPDFELHGRLGAGISKEVGAVDDRVVPEAVFSLRAESQVSLRQRVIIGAEYFPEWSSWRNFRVEAEFGWELLLDEKLDMSVKLSAYDRYDSTPQGRKANDLQYAGVLVWKF